MAADTMLVFAAVLSVTLLLGLRCHTHSVRRHARAAAAPVASHLTFDTTEITFAVPSSRTSLARAGDDQSDALGQARRGGVRQGPTADLECNPVQSQGRRLSRDAQWERLGTFVRGCNDSVAQLGAMQSRAEEQVDVAAYAIGVLLEELAPIMSIQAANDVRIAELRRSAAEARLPATVMPVCKPAAIGSAAAVAA